MASLSSLAFAACSEGLTGVPLAPDALEARGGNPGRPGSGGGGGNGGRGGGDNGGSSVDFTDDFSIFDETLWQKEDHALGRSLLLPENVSLSDPAGLLISIPSETTNGGEIRSLEKYGFGVYEVTMAAADAPGSITAFFLYEGGRGKADEIDIELLPHTG